MKWAMDSTHGCGASEWGYLFCALEVAGGASKFLYSPTVNKEADLYFPQPNRRHRLRILKCARLFYFHQGRNAEVDILSVDWMTRNLGKRVERMFPIEERLLKRRLVRILEAYFQDNTQFPAYFPTAGPKASSAPRVRRPSACKTISINTRKSRESSRARARHDLRVARPSGVRSLRVR